MQTMRALCRSWVETNVKTFLREKKENWSMDKAAGIKKLLLNFIGHNIKALKKPHISESYILKYL